MMVIRKVLALLLSLWMLPVFALADVVPLPIDTSGGYPYHAEFGLDVYVYEDPSIRVERGRVKNSDTDLNCTYDYAYVKIAHPSQLRTASAAGFDRPNRVRAEVMARRMNAVLAVNGDFYGTRPEAYVLRQGVVYRDSLGEAMDLLLIDESGDFHIIFAEDALTADKTTIDGKRVVNVLSFGPALMVDNEVVLNEKAAPTMSAPESPSQRTVIAQTGPLEYLVICCKDVGLTAQEMIVLLRRLSDHIEVAYFLDGGQSSQMVFLGRLINKTDRAARDVSDIVYFASAWDGEEP